MGPDPGCPFVRLPRSILLSSASMLQQVSDRLLFFFLPDNCTASSDPSSGLAPPAVSSGDWRVLFCGFFFPGRPTLCDQRGLWALTSRPDGPAVTGSVSPLLSALVLKMGLVNTPHSGTWFLKTEEFSKLLNRMKLHTRSTLQMYRVCIISF